MKYHFGVSLNLIIFVSVLRLLKTNALVLFQSFFSLFPCETNQEIETFHSFLSISLFLQFIQFNLTNSKCIFLPQPTGFCLCCHGFDFMASMPSLNDFCSQIICAFRSSCSELNKSQFLIFNLIISLTVKGINFNVTHKHSNNNER